MIINATSIGLKNEDGIKLDYSQIEPNKFFYDVIYNPKETIFLKRAKLFGNKTENGKMMFIYQAHQSFTIWHKLMPKIDEETINFIRLMIKIGILGDIGSGKSFIAKQFGYPVFNADKEVKKIYKKNKNCFKKLKKNFPNYIFILFQ